MTRRLSVLAVTTLLLLPAWGRAADNQPTASGSQGVDQLALADIRARANGDPVLLDEPERFAACDLRFGWWGTWTSGSQAKTGEYQNWSPSPFYDADVLTSDGTKTLDLDVNGTDQDTNRAKVYYYQPGFSARADYNRFIHQENYDSFNNMGTPTLTPADSRNLIISQQLGSNLDYAMRVQQISTSFKGTLADGLKVRLDVWGQEKDGTRQVDAVGMCYTQPISAASLPPGHPALPAYTQTGFVGQRCHVLSMPQQIDWQTTEVKPVIEMRLGESTVIEYSRPMRQFNANDSQTDRYYDHTFPLSNTNGTAPFGPAVSPYPFAVVPNSDTQMDQLKISSQIDEDNRFYSYLMIGQTLDEDIDMRRFFNDMDFRWTNTAVENVNLTGFATVYNENEETPSAANVGQTTYNYEANPTLTPPASANNLSNEMIHPLDYHKVTSGMKGVWRPWGGGFGLGGLSITAGYEYCDLQRDYALYPYDSHGNTSTTVPSGVLDEQKTITNSFQVGPDVRWSTQFDTYLHYKFQTADQPLIGLNASNALNDYTQNNYKFMSSGVYNTLLPTEDNIVEVGFNYMASDRFMLTACLGLEESLNQSAYANFTEQNFPLTINAWYAINNRLSVSGGYSLFSNFVGQTIDVASQNTAAGAVPPSSGLWSYGGHAEVWTLGWRYQATQRMRLTGQVEYVRGHDLIDNSTTYVNTTSAGVPNAINDFGSYSEVLNETTRLTLGVDYQLRPRVVIYCRYQLVDFLDDSPADQGPGQGNQTGTAQGIMGGFSAIF
jgi:hypothetical protein